MFGARQAALSLVGAAAAFTAPRRKHLAQQRAAIHRTATARKKELGFGLLHPEQGDSTRVGHRLG